MQKPIVQVVAEALSRYVGKGDGKLSANEVGKKAGVSPRTVANFLKPGERAIGKETSKKLPSGKLTELDMIAKALGLSVADLLSGSRDEPGGAQIHRLGFTFTPTEVATICDKLPLTERQRLSRLLVAGGFVSGLQVEVTGEWIDSTRKADAASGSPPSVQTRVEKAPSPAPAKPAPKASKRK